MKKLVIATFIATLFTSAAHAATPAASGGDWNGAYGGAEVGERITQSKWDTTCFESAGSCSHAPLGNNDVSMDDNDLQFGGYVGYNWQVTAMAILGIEGTLDWGDTKANVNGGFPGISPITSTNDNGWLKTGFGGSVRARAGILLDPGTMIYGTGGVAFQEFRFNASCPASDFGAWCTGARDDTVRSVRTGYVVGGGLEKSFGGFTTDTMMTPGPWLARVEYSYADYGNWDHQAFTGTIDTIGISQPLRVHTIQMGLGYKF